MPIPYGAIIRLVDCVNNGPQKGDTMRAKLTDEPNRSWFGEKFLSMSYALSENKGIGLRQARDEVRRECPSLWNAAWHPEGAERYWAAVEYLCLIDNIGPDQAEQRVTLMLPYEASEAHVNLALKA